MAKWRATFEHDRQNPGLVNPSPLVIEVNAPNEDMARMRAGMARAESWDAWFLREFYKPDIVHWTRTSLEKISD